jgi:transcriptional regulator with XRE-family HTH domain
MTTFKEAFENMDKLDLTMEKKYIEINTIEIAGFASVLQALRLPFGLECRSEIINNNFAWIGDADKGLWITYNGQCAIHEKDLHLLSTLIKRGDAHSKCVRGLLVYAEINAPLMIWSELDTYHIGTDRLSSSSTMHTIGNGGLTIHDFDVPSELYEILAPKKIEQIIEPLRIDAPEELKCVIKTYFGREYEIWNNGDIFSLPYTVQDELPNGSTRIKTFEKRKLNIGKAKNLQGYYQVHLGGRNGKTMQIHRILADAFIPNPNGYTIVNHKDGNKGNCSINNLEWCTSSYNAKHAFETGLREHSLHTKYLAYKSSLRYSDEDVDMWKQLRAEGYELKDIAMKYGTTSNTVCQYVKDKRFENISEYSALFNLAKYYEDTIKRLNDLAVLYNETKDVDVLVEIKRILPSSYMQKRIQYFSYQTLRRIYKQRLNHRLPHWQEFTKWIEGLPFAKELILIGLDNE